MTLTRLLIPAALLLVTGFQRPAYCQWVEITAMVTSPGINPATYCYAAPVMHCGSLDWGQQCDTYNAQQGAVTVTTSDGTVATPDGEWWSLRMFSLWAGEPDGPCDNDGWLDSIEFVPTRFDPDFGTLGAWRPTGEWQMTALDPAYDADPHWPVNPALYRPPLGQWTYTLDPSGLDLTGNIGGFPLASLAGASTATVMIDVGELTTGIRVFIGEPIAAADWNRDGAVEVDDLFSFLAGYFAGSVACDWDGSGWCEVADVMLYLSDWFAQ